MRFDRLLVIRAQSALHSPSSPPQDGERHWQAPWGRPSGVQSLTGAGGLGTDPSAPYVNIEWNWPGGGGPQIPQTWEQLPRWPRAPFTCRGDCSGGRLDPGLKAAVLNRHRGLLTKVQAGTKRSCPWEGSTPWGRPQAFCPWLREEKATSETLRQPRVTHARPRGGLEVPGPLLPVCLVPDVFLIFVA